LTIAFASVGSKFCFLKKLIVLFSKDAFNWSKVTVKTSIMLLRISIFKVNEGGGGRGYDAELRGRIFDPSVGIG